MKIQRYYTFALFTILLFASSYSQNRQPETITGKNGMASTAHPLASLAAIDILKQGGNAVDAAVAAAFVIGVVEPDGSGLETAGLKFVCDPV